MKKVKTTIFTKILVMVLLLVLVPNLIVGGFSTTQATRYLEEQYFQEMNAIAREKVNVLDAVVQSELDKGNIIVEMPALQAVLSAELEEEVDISDTYIQAAGVLEELMAGGRGLYENVFITDTNGLIIVDGIQGNSIGTDVTARGFFQGAVQGRQTLGEYQLSPITGRPVIVLGTPFTEGGQVTGILAMAIEIEVLGHQLTGNTFGQTGESAIIHPDGLVLAHTNQDLALNLNFSEQEGGLEKVAAQIQQGQEDSVHYELYGQSKVMSFTVHAGTGWGVAAFIEDWEIYEPIDSIRNTVMLITVVCIGVGAVIGGFFARNISNPIKEIEGQLGKAAEGDFTSKLDINRGDELGQLANSYNQMAGSLKDLVGEVQSSSEKVSSSSQQLASVAEESGKAADEIASTIQNLASGTQKQKDKTDETAQLVEEMVVSVRQVNESAQTMEQASKGVTEMADSGGKSIAAAVEQMESINSTTLENVKMVSSLGERSQQISKIVDVITGIAEQTNLLALNAAIEAARAGEHGRGFAVVAEEVRKLAEQSQQATGEIASLIGEIQQDTNQVVEVINNSQAQVETGTDKINETGEVFKEIIASVNKMAGQIGEVAAASAQIESGSSKVLEAVENIAGIAQESSAGAEQVSASTEEQTASIEESASSADELAKLSQELMELTKRFKV